MQLPRRPLLLRDQRGDQRRGVIGSEDGTENYQLEQQRINLIGDERNPGKVIEGAPLTSNTAIMGSRSLPTQP
jgi:hypothetical protein